MTDAETEIYTVKFPGHWVVTCRQKPGAPAEPIGDRTITVMSRDKAMKYARVNDAVVTDSSGNVLAKPQIDLARPKAQEAGLAEIQAENAALKARLDSMEAQLAQKQDRRGPKPK